MTNELLWHRCYNVMSFIHYSTKGCYPTELNISFAYAFFPSVSRIHTGETKSPIERERTAFVADIKSNSDSQNSEQEQQLRGRKKTKFMEPQQTKLHDSHNVIAAVKGKIW